MAVSTTVGLRETPGNCRADRVSDGEAGSRGPAPDTGEAQGASIGMTEDDTVCVLEVLAEMQRIIDRHLEKTATPQADR